MAEVTRFLLLRHATPEGGPQPKIYGELDLPLSEEGRAQARTIAARLEKVNTVYSSPRKRALETARIVAPQLEPQIDPALREIDFGLFEGLTYDQAQKAEPALYQLWMERPTEVSFPGGESWPQLRERVSELARQIRARHAGEKILIVAHGGPLRALLADAMGLPDENIFRLDQSFGGLSIIDWFGETPLVRLVNG
jgi:alpha-ribazole phosphatase/probable phosphoglycerate mutase